VLEVKLVLCPIDFSETSIRTYRHAISLAEHYRAKLVAQHIVELWRHPSADFAASAEDFKRFERALREIGMEKLQEFVKKHTHDEVQPELAVGEGIAPDSILSIAQAQNADVIVIGTHGQRGFDRLILGSTTDRVMRRASCPVLVVPPHDSMVAGDELHQVRHLNRILFCADFSENSEPALSYAISVAAEYDAELTLLHVLEHLPNSVSAKDAMTTATVRLENLLSPETRRKIRNTKTAVRIGKPYREIIQLALELQTDLVSMGARGRGTLDIAVFGSTTYRVMQLGSCPVLAVHA
jgi:nucleotide-binding universal stress UspA family protein